MTQSHSFSPILFTSIYSLAISSSFCQGYINSSQTNLFHEVDELTKKSIIKRDNLASVHDIWFTTNNSLAMLTKYTPILITILSLTSGLIIPNEEASQFLSRHRRANGILEEVLPSNINRECQLEQCDFEEYLEAKENETKQDGVNLRDVVETNSMVKNDFETIYTVCYNTMKQDDELMDKNGLDMSGLCLDTLEEHYETEGYFDNESDEYNGETFDDSDDNYENLGDDSEADTYENDYSSNY